MTKEDFPIGFETHFHSLPTQGGYYACLLPSNCGFTITCYQERARGLYSISDKALPQGFTKSKRAYRSDDTPRSKYVWREACEIAEMMLATVVLTGGLK